jgi:uncharacterized protein YegL
MAGEAIVSVNQGLQFLKSDLEGEPRAVESVWLSVISFGGQARIEVPLTELMQFVPPTLIADGGTPLGEALRLLNRSIDNELQIASGAHTGDWKPLVFLFTDGEPTDEWRGPLQEIRQRNSVRPVNIIAVGCGPNSNTTILKEITEMVVFMEHVTSGDFQKLMQWISQSVRSASRSVGSGRPGAAGGAPVADLPPLPNQFRIVM